MGITRIRALLRQSSWLRVLPEKIDNLLFEKKIPFYPMGTNIERHFEKWNKSCRFECFVFQNAPWVLLPLDKHSTKYTPNLVRGFWL